MLTKLKLALLISAPLVAGATTYALAQGNGDRPDRPDRAELLQKFDKNGDGQLDASERADMKAAFAARRAEHRQAMLDKFDTNKDGTLDAGERAAMRDAVLTERFSRMDQNGDGVLSLNEFKSGAAKAGHHHARQGKHGRWRRAKGGPSTQGGNGSL
jgi:Ca2+-binding EF-hand superfamily protein